MVRKRVPILALFVALTGIGSALADDRLVIAARETLAVVEPRSATLRLVDLPVLEFAVRAAIQCKGTAVSLTLSIADTFTTLDSDALGEKRAVEATLRVPPRQLALAASSRFCVADDVESVNELLVPGLATAHASLQCLRDDQLSAHFASAPLQVRLQCARSPAADQEPPASATER